MKQHPEPPAAALNGESMKAECRHIHGFFGVRGSRTTTKIWECKDCHGHFYFHGVGDWRPVIAAPPEPNPEPPSKVALNGGGEHSGNQELPPTKYDRLKAQKDRLTALGKYALVTDVEAAKLLIELDVQNSASQRRISELESELMAERKKSSLYESTMLAMESKITAAEAELLRLQAKGEWIPVEQELPPTPKSWRDGSKIGYYSEYYEVVTRNGIEVADYSFFAGEEGSWSTRSGASVEVTHYKPLPTPPKGEEIKKVWRLQC